MLDAGSKMKRPRRSFWALRGEGKNWWSRNDTGIGGVKILVKKEMSGNVNVKSKRDKVMEM